MKLSSSVIGLVLLLWCRSSLLAGDHSIELYQQALQQIEDGSYASAMSLLKEAVSLRPAPVLRFHTQGMLSVDYLPYLFLGVAAAELGEKDVATRYLDVSTSYGAVIQSEGGHPLLQKYRLELANADVLREPASDSVRPRLSADVYEDVQREVVSRCGLDPSKPRSGFPWYFYYELGLELLNRDDPSRALESFLESLERKDQPQRAARIYGMWYTSYAPYYSIGLAHYQLENYSCMRDAFHTSRALDELDAGDESYRNRERLLKEGPQQ